MVQLYDGGAYVLNGTEIIPDTADAAKILAGKMGAVPSKEDAKKQTVSTLLDIKVLPKTMTDGYGAWWHVGIASTSAKESVRNAYKSKEENLSKARKY